MRRRTARAILASDEEDMDLNDDGGHGTSTASDGDDENTNSNGGRTSAASKRPRRT
jgi:hypothetical protein